MYFLSPPQFWPDDNGNKKFYQQTAEPGPTIFRTQNPKINKKKAPKNRIYKMAESKKLQLKIITNDNFIVL